MDGRFSVLEKNIIQYLLALGNYVHLTSEIEQHRNWIFCGSFWDDILEMASLCVRKVTDLRVPPTS
jgi:hypothetical protein